MKTSFVVLFIIAALQACSDSTNNSSSSNTTQQADSISNGLDTGIHSSTDTSEKKFKKSPTTDTSFYKQ